MPRSEKTSANALNENEAAAPTTWEGAEDPKETKEIVSRKANALLDGWSSVRVLEAGCGAASHVRFGSSAHIVGIDISRNQLEKNTGLQEKILGDIQEYPLPKEQFDVAVCWMVLEHLSKPKNALHNMFQSLKPRGLLVIGVPNLISFKGIVTKPTPFWFHVLFYKFMRYKSHPFPTYLRTAIVPKRIVQLAGDNGFSVEFCRLVEGDVARKLRARFWFVRAASSIVNSIVQFISCGKAQSLFLDNCFFIFRKGAAKSPQSR